MTELPAPFVPADLDCRHLPFPAHELLDAMFPNLPADERAKLINRARQTSPSGIVERR